MIGYLGSLAVLLIASFWTVDALSGETTQNLSLDNYKQLLDQSVYRDVALRTIGVAAAATITDAILAFPIAFYMAKLAGPKTKGGPRGGDPDAALVLLPGQGLRLADDALGRGGAQLGPRSDRARGARVSGSPGSGWSRATSGSLT